MKSASITLLNAIMLGYLTSSDGILLVQAGARYDSSYSYTPSSYSYSYNYNYYAPTGYDSYYSGAGYDTNNDGGGNGGGKNVTTAILVVSGLGGLGLCMWCCS